MPRGQPFTYLCARLARIRAGAFADLHTHTRHSDGEFTPSQVVHFARDAGLSVIAITDHDTTAGLAEAVETARSITTRPPRVLPGVEITTDYDGRECHVVALGFDPLNGPLQAALAGVRAGRKRRFDQILAKLADLGVVIPDDVLASATAGAESLGRGHLATALVAANAARNRHDAFYRYLGPIVRDLPADYRLPFAAAMTLVRAAGGVTSLAHPPADTTEATLRDMHGRGLTAVEVVHPGVPVARANDLRVWATGLGMAVTGGSDFHARRPGGRGVGSLAVGADEFDGLREWVGPRESD